MRLIIVEDDLALGEAISTSFRNNGYAVDHLTSAKAAIYSVELENYDAMILDLGLPDKNGFELISQLRASGKSLPILILTARDVVDDRVLGLDLGADDYIIKPVALKELQARIRALVRRSVGINNPKINIGNVLMDITNRMVYVETNLVELSGREWEVLEYLATRPGRIVSKELLIQAITSWDNNLSENAIEAYVHRIRIKLSNASVHIRTIRGLGYMLEELS